MPKTPIDYTDDERHEITHALKAVLVATAEFWDALREAEKAHGVEIEYSDDMIGQLAGDLAEVLDSMASARTGFSSLAPDAGRKGELGIPHDMGMKPFGMSGGVRGDLCPVDRHAGRVSNAKKLDIDAVMLEDRWSYSKDEFEPKRVHIYAVSGAGSLLYEEEDGKKDKDAYDCLRLFDQAKVDRFKALKKQQREAREALEELLEGWPKLKARELRGDGETDE